MGIVINAPVQTPFGKRHGESLGEGIELAGAVCPELGLRWPKPPARSRGDTHAEIAVAAARAGKMVLCEKPLGRNGDEARRMVEAVESAGVPNMVWYNYRRVPAVTLAKRLVDEGKLGRVFHYRAKFLQDWTIKADLPQGGQGLWRLDINAAGAGVSGDLLAHCIDTAIWLNGRMDTLQCAVVLAKLERFDWEVARRREIGARYTELLRAIPGIRVLELRPDRTNVYAQYTILADDRERVQAALQARGIPTAIHYPIALHRQPAYRSYGLEARLPVSDDLADRVISLPMYPDLDAKLQDDIVDAVRRSVA